MTDDLTPSLARVADVQLRVGLDGPASVTVIGYPVPTVGPVPAGLGADRDTLSALGFRGTAGQTRPLPGEDGVVRVAVGIGEPAAVDSRALRDAAGCFAMATGGHVDLAFDATDVDLDPALAAQVVVEGVLLGRWDFDVFRSKRGPFVRSLALLVGGDQVEAERGMRHGRAFARAQSLARDLAAAPPTDLSAPRMASIAREAGAAAGLIVQVYGRAELETMGCGGLLGVNRGSAEEPRMIKMTYQPNSTTLGHVGLVGKGIMYDSGGVSLKPSDVFHSQMKNDMSGAAAILGAMCILAELDCPVSVTGWLMCTDNMLQGSALKLGDVLRIRGGSTVEIMDTDAEGRLVMSDGLVLATEDGVDAIVDIATLTGACLRALGPKLAGVMGNDPQLVDLVIDAGALTDEQCWQLPLDRRYRSLLDSSIADIKNWDEGHPGATTAALFLETFVGATPWAHIDIAGAAQNGAVDGFRPVGVTGFGARLLAELAMDFRRAM